MVSGHEECDKLCKSHEKSMAALDTHKERLGDLEDAVDDLREKHGVLSTKVSVAGTIVAMSFMLLLTIATFGFFQLLNFQEQYHKDQLDLTRILSEMKHPK